MIRTCTLCGNDKEDVPLVSVTPATWNGFNSVAMVCTECQGSRRFMMWAKTGAAKKKAAASVAVVEEKPATPTTLISHRRTGALLHTVASGSLTESKLSGMALVGADLQHASMRGADLHKADLRMADLSGADLRGADLRGVNLRGADLRGTDFRNARMHRAEISDAIYDTGTLWPADFDPHPCGAQKKPRIG